MSTKTKKFSCDLVIAEFKEIDNAIKKTGQSRREWLLTAIKTSPNKIIGTQETETLKIMTEKAQEEINAAYKVISDLYLDVGAELLKTDRQKAVELLSKALSLKAPLLSNALNNK